MKYSGGLIKNEKQAYSVLFAFVVIAGVISLFLVFGGGSTSNPPPPLIETTSI